MVWFRTTHTSLDSYYYLDYAVIVLPISMAGWPELALDRFSYRGFDTSSPKPVVVQCWEIEMGSKIEQSIALEEDSFIVRHEIDVGLGRVARLIF